MRQRMHGRSEGLRVPSFNNAVITTSIVKPEIFKIKNSFVKRTGGRKNSKKDWRIIRVSTREVQI